MTFIVFEGIDGCGKSTQLKILKKWFTKMGYRALFTYEPTHNPIGEIIRKSIQNDYTRFDPKTEALLFAADRLNHIKRIIQPVLDQGDIVISDRYVYSSYAYQGSRGVLQPYIMDINKYAIKEKLCILIDVPADIAVERLIKRGKQLNVFETIGFLKRVRARYLRLPYVFDSIVIVNGDRPEKDIAMDIQKIVDEALE